MIPNQDILESKLDAIRKERGDDYADAICALCGTAAFMKGLPKEVANDAICAQVMTKLSLAFANILKASTLELTLQSTQLVRLAFQEKQ